ncbi:conjugal transfer protein, partial [Streptococcus agalactiae]|nr:conjugal transfer protein [Streptococcus agalactiae]
FYVIFKIVEAIVIAIPIILVQILNVIAQLLVLIMMLLFPIALLISFIPRMQDIIFGVLKVMMGGLAFPAITSLLTLIIFYLEKIIENMMTSGFDNTIKGFASLVVFALLFKLMVVVIVKALIY